MGVLAREFLELYDRLLGRVFGHHDIRSGTGAEAHDVLCNVQHLGKDIWLHWPLYHLGHYRTSQWKHQCCLLVLVRSWMHWSDHSFPGGHGAGQARQRCLYGKGGGRDLLGGPESAGEGDGRVGQQGVSGGEECALRYVGTRDAEEEAVVVERECPVEDDEVLVTGKNAVLETLASVAVHGVDTWCL